MLENTYYLVIHKTGLNNEKREKFKGTESGCVRKNTFSTQSLRIYRDFTKWHTNPVVSKV